VYGDGDQVMDMIYVADLAEILVRALMEDHVVFDGIFEGGSGRATTVKEIAETVIALTGRGRVRAVSMRPGETPHAVVLADTSTLGPLRIDPAQFVSLAAGLRLTIDHYLSIVSRADCDTERGEREREAQDEPLHRHSTRRGPVRVSKP
jgi:nucleoside-diphosphate-sugar epimerase